MRLVAIGGSDAGIRAALRARELDPSADVTVVLADAYPNFSICGIPYYVSGDVGDWHNLAHRTIADLEATGMTSAARHASRTGSTPAPTACYSAALDGREEVLNYDALVSAPARCRSARRSPGLTTSAPTTACISCTRWATRSRSCAPSRTATVRRAVIVGAGYVGLEMAEALTSARARGHPGRAAPRGPADRRPGARRARPRRAPTPRRQRPVRHPRRRDRQRQPGSTTRSRSSATGPDEQPLRLPADVVLVSVGVRPDSEARRRRRRRARRQGSDRRRPPDAHQPSRRARRRRLRHHPPPATRHHLSPARHHRPQARTDRRRERARRHARVRRQPRHPGRQGLRPRRRPHRPPRPRSRAAGFDPVTVASEADDHKAYYPGSHKIAMRYTGDRRTGRLLGVQLVGHLGSEIAKRIDIAATAIHNETHRRRDLRPRPLLHPAARLPMGRAPDRRSSLDHTNTAEHVGPLALITLSIPTEPPAPTPNTPPASAPGTPSETRTPRPLCLGHRIPRGERRPGAEMDEQGVLDAAPDQALLGHERKLEMPVAVPKQVRVPCRSPSRKSPAARRATTLARSSS